MIGGGGEGELKLSTALGEAAKDRQVFSCMPSSSSGTGYSAPSTMLNTDINLK